MQMNMRDDFRCWDNVETITYSSTRNGGDMVDSIDNVRRHQVSLKEAATSFGAYVSGDWDATPS